MEALLVLVCLHEDGLNELQGFWIRRTAIFQMHVVSF